MDVATHWIVTSDGGTLAIENASGAVVGCREHSLGPARQPLYVLIPAGGDVGFLIARDTRHLFRIGPQPRTASALGLQVLRSSGSATCRFRDPVTRRYLSARALPADGDVCDALLLDRPQPRRAEQFRLVPLASETTPPGATDLGRAIGALPPGSALAGTLALLQAPTSRWSPLLLGALGRMLSFEDLTVLAQALLDDPAILARLCDLHPGDIWATHALPSLSSWRRRQLRQPPGTLAAPTWRRRQLDRDTDPAASLDVGRFVSLPFACNAAARALAQPGGDICVLTTVRNEGPYLLEWLAYYRALGVDRFFVYSNDNDDGSDVLLRALADAGAINWVGNDVRDAALPQFKAYGNALSIDPEILGYRWALVLDLDEFLVFNRGLFPTLADYLRWHEEQPVDAVALNWLLFSPNGNAHWRDAPVLDRFKQRDVGPNAHVKSLIRPRRFIQSECHFPLTYRDQPFIFRNAARGEHVTVRRRNRAHSDEPSADHAWINHYYYKSIDEFVAKLAKGRADAGNGVRDGLLSHEIAPGRIERMLRGCLDRFGGGGVVTDPRAARLRDAAGASVASLTALPNVAAINAEIGARMPESLAHGRRALLAAPRSVVSQGLLDQLQAALEL